MNLWPLLVYLAGMPLTPMILWWVRKYNDGVLKDQGYYRRAHYWYEEDPCLAIGWMFWPLILLAIPITVIAQDSGKWFERFGQNASKKAKLRVIKEAEKNRILEEHEKEIDEFLTRRDSLQSIQDAKSTS